MPEMNASPAVSAVECHVAADDVLIRFESSFAWRLDDDASTAETFAAIVVHVAFFNTDGDSMNAECKETLNGRTGRKLS